MLAVEPNSFEMRDPASMNEQIEDQIEPELQVQKSVDKKPVVTPFRILVGLALFFLLIAGSYQLYTTMAPAANKSAI